MKLLAFTLIFSAVLFSIRAGVAMHETGTKIQNVRTAQIERAAQ